MSTVRKLRRMFVRIVSDDRDLSLEAGFTRMAIAVLAGLFGPPMLALPPDRLNWQIWGCLALVAPLIALVQAAARRSCAASASLGFAAASLGAAAAYWPHLSGLGEWLIILPIETAIILAAAGSRFGGLFPLAVLFGLAIAERIGQVSARPEAITAMIFAPSAAVCVALGARALDRGWRARLRRDWLRTQRHAPISSEMFLWLDRRGRVLEVGGDLAEALELDPERLSGEGLLHRIKACDRPEFTRAFERALSADETAPAFVRIRVGEFEPGQEGDGAEAPRYLHFETRMRRLVGGARADSAAIAIAFKDVSDAKEAERQLESVRLEAAAAISMKDRLLANVSHELRTPLNAIIGFSEMLADPRLTPAQPEQRAEYARIIRTSAEHLLSVVNLLLDMSKLEAGRYEITPEPFAIGALIRSCVDMVRLKAEDRGIELQATGVDSNQEIVADKRACRQILLNLLSNAVKFTPPKGHVAIEVEVVAGRLEIAVVDTGIGISAEHLPQLGDPFFQARSGYDRTAEGAGLGLALVRGLVGLHGGSVRIESAPGIGTRVSVGLPIDGRAPPRQGESSPRFEVLAGMNRRRPMSGPVAIEERKIA